jgi:hypothetical protein
MKVCKCREEKQRIIRYGVMMEEYASKDWTVSIVLNLRA